MAEEEESWTTVDEEGDLLGALSQPYTSLVLSCDFEEEAGSEQEEALVAAFRHSSVTWIDFDHASGEMSSVLRAIFRALTAGNTTIRNVSGMYVDCDNRTGVAMAEMLRTNHSLESLQLDELGQHWSAATAISVLNGLAANRGVKELTLTHVMRPEEANSEDTGAALASVFQSNTTLCSLRLDDIAALNSLQAVLPLWRQHPALTSVALYPELGQPGVHSRADFDISAALTALNPTSIPAFTAQAESILPGQAPESVECMACGELRPSTLCVVQLAQDGTLTRQGVCSVACAERAREAQAEQVRDAWKTDADEEV